MDPLGNSTQSNLGSPVRNKYTQNSPVGITKGRKIIQAFKESQESFLGMTHPQVGFLTIGG